VHGILVLCPLPEHVLEAKVFQALNPCKDIESVHPEHAGLLALGPLRFVQARTDDVTALGEAEHKLEHLLHSRSSAGNL
jgi:5,10-methylene-tetrahydrofolate dehydrogenase/methenyl tetrahydrofolate cyclohydrolase